MAEPVIFKEEMLSLQVRKVPLEHGGLKLLLHPKFILFLQFQGCRGSRAA